MLPEKPTSSTKTKILEFALHELIDHGYGAFTQKNVAARMGISLGNLTYHYPTKAELVDAMIDEWFDTWSNEFKESLYQTMERSLNVEDFVDWVMESAITEDNVKLYRELWAMSTHNTNLEITLHTLYEKAIDFVLEAFSVPRHAWNDQYLRSTLFLLACTSEGAAAIWINSPRSKANPDLIKSLAKKTLSPLLAHAIDQAKSEND